VMRPVVGRSKGLQAKHSFRTGRLTEAAEAASVRSSAFAQSRAEALYQVTASRQLRRSS
jgi:hypothetical protein